MTVLESERLLFRDHEEADLEPFRVMEADPGARRYHGPPRTREAAERIEATTDLERLRGALRQAVHMPDQSEQG